MEDTTLNEESTAEEWYTKYIKWGILLAIPLVNWIAIFKSIKLLKKEKPEYKYKALGILILIFLVSRFALGFICLQLE